MTAAETTTTDEHTSARYVHQGGERYVTHKDVSLRPHQGQSNASFEQLVHRMVEALCADGHSVSYELRRGEGGAVVGALVHIQLAQPEPAPIDATDTRCAGGRIPRERGHRA